MIEFQMQSTYVRDRCGDLFDVAFIAEPLDQRGEFTIEEAKYLARKTCKISYDPKTFILNIDDLTVRPNQLEKVVATYPALNVLLDATTLDFPDILLIIRAYVSQRKKVCFSFLYAEPEEYQTKPSEDENDAPHFVLSDSFEAEHHPIPGFTPLNRGNKSQAWITVFLGFEGRRLRNLIADAEAEDRKHYNLVFGVPPYRTVWENHSLIENCHVLDDIGRDDILYAGANNPFSCFNIIQKLYEATRNPSVVFELSPLGTKPAAIACAVFAGCHREVGIRYDYPKRSSGRTKGVGKVHLFVVQADGAELGEY
ncbi:hypothetical protein H8K32_09990 [Undibacterium jejuense]|uniref:Uncharacterized protein n=1 Tax=Undibacterium jejuense TaxID=1344949 RepID=A0A923HHB8_9BURK|nr:hypothetical protein [Undibacterium jejuense]MBC3862428.1 hypothetical protein [Undibacterium jejuense]